MQCSLDVEMQEMPKTHTVPNTNNICIIRRITQCSDDNSDDNSDDYYNDDYDYQNDEDDFEDDFEDNTSNITNVFNKFCNNSKILLQNVEEKYNLLNDRLLHLENTTKFTKLILHLFKTKTHRIFCNELMMQYDSLKISIDTMIQTYDMISDYIDKHDRDFDMELANSILAQSNTYLINITTDINRLQLISL